jgi:hypothetical protein
MVTVVCPDPLRTKTIGEAEHEGTRVRAQKIRRVRVWGDKKY